MRKVDVSHRSHLVAKEIKTYEAPELFAATPPIESLKCLLRGAAQDKGLSIMHVDFARVLSRGRKPRHLRQTAGRGPVGRRGILVREDCKGNIGHEGRGAELHLKDIEK